MSARHTPGPWFAGQSENQRTKYPQQRTIGLRWDNESGILGYRQPEACSGDYLNLSGYCSEADGHLIAAAPDPLEALEQCSKCTGCSGSGVYVNRRRDDDGVFVTETLTCKVCGGDGVSPIARAALVKARGGVACSTQS